MKILAVSDVEAELVYTPKIVERFGDAACIISCGDLPENYLEYIVSSLNRPFFFVHGNHARGYHVIEGKPLPRPAGGTSLHRRVTRGPGGLLLAGIEGSLRYSEGPLQYSQAEMWEMVLRLAPRLVLNRVLYGRFLDVFATHAPPWGIHDQDDRPHQGIHAFRWLLQTFRPALHLHGHVHIYQQYATTETHFARTRVINVYGYKQIELVVRGR